MFCVFFFYLKHFSLIFSLDFHFLLTLSSLHARSLLYSLQFLFVFKSLVWWFQHLIHVWYWCLLFLSSNCVVVAFFFWKFLLVAILGTAVLVLGPAISKPLVMCSEVWGNRCFLVLWLELSLFSEPVLLDYALSKCFSEFSSPFGDTGWLGCSGAGYFPSPVICLWWCSSRWGCD